MVVDGLKTLNNNNSQQYHHIEGTAEEPPPSKAADHFYTVVSKRPKLPSTNSENKENMFDDTTLIIDGAANNRRRRNGEKYNRSGLAYPPPHNIVKEDSCLLCDTLISEQLCYHDDKLKRFHRCHSAKDVLHNNNVNKNNNSISKSNLLTTAEATPLWFHEIQSKTYMFGTAAATTERSSSSSPLVAIDATTKLARKKAYTTTGTITTIINATAASSNSDKCNSSSAANPIDDHHQSSILIKSNEFKKNCIANGSNSNDRRNSNSNSNNNIVTTALGVAGLVAGGGADKKLVLRFTYDDALLLAVDDLFIQRDMLSFIDNDQPQTKKHAQLIPFTAGSDFLRHIERLTTTTNTSLSMERLSELFMMLLETGGCRRSKSYEDRAADTTSDAVEKGGLLLRPFGDNARKLLAANRNEAVRAAGLMIGLLLGFCFHHNGDNTNNVNGCLLLEVVVGSADAANQVVAASSSYFGKTTAKNKIAAETLRRSIDTVSSSSSGGRRDIVAIKTKSRYFSIGNDIIEKRTIITNRRNRCYDSIKIWDINAFDNDKSNNKRPSDNDNNEHNIIRRRKRNDRDAYWLEVSENISKTVADFDDTLDTLEDLIKQFCLESMEMSAADDDVGDYVISPSITREGISSQQQLLSEEDDIERYSSLSYEMKSSYEQDEDVLSEEGGDNSTNDKEDGVYYLSKNNLSPKNFCEYNLWYSPLSETTVIYERLLLRQEDHHRHQLDEDELTSPPLDGGVAAANNGTDYKSYHLWGSPLVEGGIFQWIKQNGTDRLLSQQPASSSDPFDAIYNLWSSPDILNCLWSSNDKSNAPASDGRINNNNDITKDDQVDIDDTTTNGCHDDHNQWLHSSGFRTSSDVQYFALSTQPELAYSISFENSGMCTSSSSDVVAAREKNRLDENCPMVNDERPADDYFPKPLFDCTIAVVPSPTTTTDQQQPEFKNTLSEDRQDLLNASSVEGFSFFCDHRFNNNNNTNTNNMVDSLNENSSMGSMYSLFGENIDYCNNGSKMKSPLCNDNRATDRIILNPLTTTFGRYYNSSLGNDDYYPDSCSHGGNNSCDDGDDEDRLLFHDIRQQGRQLEMESYREQSVIATAAANHHHHQNNNNSRNILSSIASMFPNPSSSSSSCDLILTKSTRNNEYNLFPNRLATNDQQQQNSVVDDVLAYLQTAINENRRKNNEENANETVADDEQHKQLMYLDNEVERINFPLSLKISLTPERYLFQPVEPFVDVKLDPAPVYAKSPNGSLYYEGCKVVDFKHPAAGTNNDVFRPKFKIIRQDKASQTDEEPPSYYHHLQQQQQQQQWTMTDQMYQRNATMPTENNFYQLLNRSNNFKEPSSTTTNVVDELEEPEFLDLPSATAGISFTNIVAI